MIKFEVNKLFEFFKCYHLIAYPEATKLLNDRNYLHNSNRPFTQNITCSRIYRNSCFICLCAQEIPVTKLNIQVVKNDSIEIIIVFFAILNFITLNAQRNWSEPPCIWEKTERQLTAKNHHFRVFLLKDESREQFQGSTSAY